MTVSESWIKTHSKGIIFEITLNRPDKRNAVQLGLLQALANAVAVAEKTSGTRLIVIRGEGKAFCAGLDLMAMGGNEEAFGADWMQHPHEITRLWQAAVNRLAESPLPTLALLHGYCLGAGLEIALACDFRYADSDTVFSLEETRLGLIPDVGGTTRLAQLIGFSRAKEMILTGRRISTSTAEAWGLVNRTVEMAEFEAAAEALATEIAACAPLAVAAAKRVILGLAQAEQGLHLEKIEQAPLFQTQDLREGMQAALERRAAQWKGK